MLLLAYHLQKPQSPWVCLMFLIRDYELTILFHMNISSTLIALFFFKCVLVLKIVISPIWFFFLLYSMVTQLHIHAHILFSPIIMLHHKWLDIVPSATQQELIAHPFQRQQSSSINPKLPVPSTPSPSPWQPQVYSPSPWFSFLWKVSFVPYIRFQWYHMVFVFLFLTYFPQDESL